MRLCLLKDELEKLQQYYKEVLLTAQKKFFKTKTTAILDEILVFWMKNKKLVKFILRSYAGPYESYIFTCATKLGTDNLEHYPFVTLGKFHIWDDPLCRYIISAKTVLNESFSKKVEQQIFDNILDNLKIIDDTQGAIVILPVSYFAQELGESGYKFAEKYFFSLFKKRYTFEEYRQQFHTIGDIKDALKTGSSYSIVFTDFEDLSIDFAVRFTQFKNSTTLPLPQDADEAEIFHFVVLCNFRQTISTISMCFKYKLIPYIRYDVVVKIMAQFLDTYGDQHEYQNIIFKGIVAHLLHHTLNNAYFKSLDFIKYYNIIKSINFDSHLFIELEKHEITPCNIKPDIICGIIDELFASLFIY